LAADQIRALSRLPSPGNQLNGHGRKINLNNMVHMYTLAWRQSRRLFLILVEFKQTAGVYSWLT
jgi:hypothetical protein